MNMVTRHSCSTWSYDGSLLLINCNFSLYVASIQCKITLESCYKRKVNDQSYFLFQRISIFVFVWFHPPCLRNCFADLNFFIFHILGHNRFARFLNWIILSNDVAEWWEGSCQPAKLICQKYNIYLNSSIQ